MGKRLALAAGVLGLVAAACGGRSSPSPAPSPVPAASPSMRPLPDPLPEIIARVNDRPIPLRHAVLIAERLLGDKVATTETRANAYRAAMEQLIARELLFQEAVARRLTPDAAAVERAHDQARGQHKTEADWQKFLKLQGLDVQGFKTELRTRHTVEALIKAEAERVPSDVPDSEVQAFYESNPSEFQVPEQLRASHILVRAAAPGDAAAKAAAREKAQRTLDRIRKGEAFAEVAGEVSEDQGSASQGGALPPFGRGVMTPPFEEAAFALKAGALSPVVETTFGYHIILLHERQPPTTRSLEESQEAIRAHLVVVKRQSALTALLAGLRARARVETYL
jgi:peptidyl-prolyl cis-trans isomerase C